MESHGTDRALERISQLESAHIRLEKDLQSLTVQVTSLASSVGEFKTSIDTGLRDIQARISEVRERKTPWGQIWTGAGVFLMVGGFLWGEIKFDQVRNQDRITAIESTRNTREDAIRMEERMQRRIDRLEEMIFLGAPRKQP